MLLQRASLPVVYAGLAVLLGVALVLSAGTGAVKLPVPDMLRYVLVGLRLDDGAGADPIALGLFLQIRLPRVVLVALVGASLSVSGAVMQALFRNPIVEPGLAGTSAGAALGAASIFVLGKSSAFAFTSGLGPLALPVTACAGAFLATLAVYRLSTTLGRVHVATMLLAGIAVNALASAGTGYLSYRARDPQARSITFWQLGTFSGATWRNVAIAAVAVAVGLPLVLRRAKALNALLLGEDEAALLGFRVERLTMQVMALNTVLVGVSTALVGIVAFVGLIVPHILRMLKSADNRFLIIGSALLGASLMQGVDVVTRVVIAPAELPVGIVTALVGAPVFLWILVRSRRAGPGGTL